MATDKEKMARLEGLLQNFNVAAESEAVSLALSINDEEDRDLALLSLARVLARTGRLDQAWGVAQFIAGAYEKAQILGEVAAQLAGVGDLERALFIFSEATANASANELAPWQQAELLLEIAKSLRRCGATYKANQVRGQALAVAHLGAAQGNLQDSADCASVLGEIAVDLAESGQLEKALQVARSLRHTGRRERVAEKLRRLTEQVKQAA